MPASGVNIADEVNEAYNRIKNPPKDLHWVKFGFDATGTSIIVKGKLEKTQDFNVQDIAELFPEDECFYMVVDVKIKEADGVNLDKLVFIQWCPDSAPVKHKMLMSSSAGSLKVKLDGLGAKLEASDLSEVTFEEIRGAINTARGKQS